MNRALTLIYSILLFSSTIAQTGFSDLCTDDSVNTVLPNDKLTCVFNYCKVNTQKKASEIKQVLDEALPFIQKHKMQNRLGEFYYYYGNVYLHLEVYDSAEFFFRKSLDSISANNVDLIYNLSKNLGVSYRRQLDFSKSLAFFDKALSYANQTNNKNYIAITYNEIGKLYTEQKQYSDAISNFQKAINTFKELKDTLSVAQVYTNISELYTNTGNGPLAMDYLQKAHKIYSRLNDAEGLASAYMNMGQVYFGMTNYREAELNLHKAIRTYEDINYQLFLATAYNKLGNVKLKLEKNDEALYCLNRALDIYQKLNDHVGIVTVLKDVGNFYYEIEDYYNAQVFLFKSLDHTNTLQHPILKLELYELLAESFAKSNNFDKAYTYRMGYEKLYHEALIIKKNHEHILLRSKLKIKEKEVAEFKTSYNEKQAKLQKQIAFYRVSIFLLLIVFFAITVWLYLRYNRKIKLKTVVIDQKKQVNVFQTERVTKLQQKIEDLAAVKDRLLLIASKNIVEPVESLNRLVGKLADSKNEKRDAALLSFIDANKDSMTMAYNLIENLLYWSRQQQSKVDYEPNYCNLETLLLKVIAYQNIRAQAKNVKIKSAGFEGFEAYVDRKMIEVAFRNIIENAIKFSTIGSEVLVVGKKYSDKLSIRVIDKGVGMTKEQIHQLTLLNKADAAIGTHGEKGGGIGYLLAWDFIKRNFGEIKLSSSIAEGTVVEVMLPSSSKKLT